MNVRYSRTSITLTLRDSPQNIDFHIRSGDYFLHLATLMGFMEEALSDAKFGTDVSRQRALARELRNDLRYVQANYEVSPRPLSDIQIIRPSGNVLKKY